MDTRPTSDRLRETLFNVLSPRIAGAKFADLYAGSGAIGIEAISRGASFCWFAENTRPAADAIRANLSALKIASGYALEDRGVAKLLQSLGKKTDVADIVFLDPPYADLEAYKNTLDALAKDHPSLLSPDALVVAEHRKKQRLEEKYGALNRTRILEQGEAALSFYALRDLTLD